MTGFASLHDLPRTSHLYQDYVYRYPKVGEFFNGNFRDPKAFQRLTEEVMSRPLPREELVTILREQNQRFGCGSETLRNIETLARNDGCAVVTGQQVGLFSGPLYTIYKSLTAIKLSEYLNQCCPGCFVPVFWLASDDHDFAEIDHVDLLTQNNEIEKVLCPAGPSLRKLPASKILLLPEIRDCIRHLQELTHDSEFKQDILARLGEAYKPGRSFADAFAIWMTYLFKSYGLIFIDAAHEGLKNLGKNVFHCEIAGDSPSTRTALEASNRLYTAGYDTQIPLHEDVLNLFFAEEERRTIQVKGSGFALKEPYREYKKGDLLDILEQSPHAFSPNVLLRPLYQDALLPTVAYVGGPSEIAYFAQMKGVYASFELPMPVIYPRKSVTLLERKIGKLCDSFGLRIQDIWVRGDRIISDTVRKQIPDAILKGIQNAADNLKKNFDMLMQDLVDLDPTLEKSAMSSFGKAERQLKLLEAKVLQALKKRNSVVTRQLHKVKNSLYPKDRLQERVFNITPFLIKYGHSLIDNLNERIDIGNYDHQVIRF
ncbi:MAG: bacillithiol biosynthesis cysteine-adding enzyme BshC [Candidatus Aminicenantes bacterium]|nr:bacillithiol biosynthesis cysteine-adding enzyme BshC [Candidatus Aminicenantes bacterium]